MKNCKWYAKKSEENSAIDHGGKCREHELTTHRNIVHIDVKNTFKLNEEPEREQCCKANQKQACPREIVKVRDLIKESIIENEDWKAYRKEKNQNAFSHVVGSSSVSPLNSVVAAM